MKLKFKLGRIPHTCKLIPTIQIEWNPVKDYDFAIVIAFLNYGIGVRFSF